LNNLAAHGPVRAALTVCDIADYSRLTPDEQRDQQNRLAELELRAAFFAGIDRRHATMQPSGDGQQITWPPDTDVVRLVVDYVRELGNELARVNRGLVPSNQLRLRLSIVDGLHEPASLGIAGNTAVTAARLVNARQARTALARAVGAPLVVVLEDHLYQNVVAAGFRALRPSDYVPIMVREPEKGFEARAWLTVPGVDPLLFNDVNVIRWGRLVGWRINAAIAALITNDGH
jgi:hypothetical protein